MERMSELPDSPETAPGQAGSTQPKARFHWLSTLQATATRRALLLTALGGLLIAGLITALPLTGSPNGLAGYLESEILPSAGSRGTQTFNEATPGNCLAWPDNTPDEAKVVDCQDDHQFEVAEAVDMSTFPGAEYGPDAAPPSPARIQQISQEQCQVAVRRYLGAQYDPNSRFTIGMLWSGDKAWSQSGERRMLCGLQLPGPDNRQLPFKGKVAEIDQSKVWPAGTCLGIDPASNQPTDIPVDCATPHAMEVTGSLNLAERFPGPGLPAEADQDAFIKDTCTRLTDEYLAPIELRTTTLTLIYSTVSLPSWTAGSRQVACSVGATLGNGGWATLINDSKGPLLINGQPPVPPPDIPVERLNLPPIEYTPPTAEYYPNESSGSSSGSGTTTTDSGTSSQHLPGQTDTSGTTPPATETPVEPPPTGNVFNPPPPEPVPAPAPVVVPPPAEPVPALPPGPPPGPVEPPLPPPA
ncbi:MAG: septum formation family protein [Mycobacterium sp.]